MSVTHASFTIERRFAQPPVQAFSAFADPDLKRRWFADTGKLLDALARFLAGEPAR